MRRQFSQKLRDLFAKDDPFEIQNIPYDEFENIRTAFQPQRLVDSRTTDKIGYARFYAHSNPDFCSVAAAERVFDVSIDFTECYEAAPDNGDDKSTAISRNRVEHVRDLLKELAVLIRQTPTSTSEKIALQYEHDAALLGWVLGEKGENDDEKTTN